MEHELDCRDRSGSRKQNSYIGFTEIRPQVTAYSFEFIQIGWDVDSSGTGCGVTLSSSFGLGAARFSGGFAGPGCATEVILPPLKVTVSVMVSPSTNGLPRRRIS